MGKNTKTEAVKADTVEELLALTPEEFAKWLLAGI